MKKGLMILLGFMLLFSFMEPLTSYAKDKETKGELPSHVLNISKDNTYPNSTEDQIVLEPSEMTKELLDDADVKITNPELVEMLNESTLKPSPIAIGYRGEIFLGRWPLAYHSKETSINWEYQDINSNQLNNQGSQANEKISYMQKEEKHIKGGLTAKINQADQVKKLILLEAQQNTKLPLAFHTVIGQGSKQNNTYGVPINKTGILNAYAPAVNEKGEIAFGEVYLKLKGSKKELIVKNVANQGIGAWIPIQDHVSFSYNVQ
ncbi:YfkD famly protein [Thalassobacillus sp. CUG 92003]|uniref:YfkD famly protein n=1 Tax=Thalassobacillus sp. CUG 92003 TaxID=2736641 RepID=UPI0015E749B5|nr:YfkD famly protein [Thalassobacillus sp. CUG 92003]